MSDGEQRLPGALERGPDGQMIFTLGGSYDQEGVETFRRTLLQQGDDPPCRTHGPTPAQSLWRPLLGVMGYIGAGKDSVADVLVADYGYRKWGFSELIKIELYELFLHCAFGTLDEWMAYCEEEKRKGDQSWVRRLLQWWGTDVRRRQDPDYWVKMAEARGCLEPGTVIPSVRFVNEAEAVRRAQGLLWRVERPGTAPGPEAHISEHEHRKVTPDLILANDSDLGNLRALVHRVTPEWVIARWDRLHASV